MSVKILIITHENIGSALLNVALKTFGKLPLAALVVPIHYNTDPDVICGKINFLVTNLNNPDGILVLTDLFGSTPNNIARSLQNNFNVRVVTGVNLPMLIRIMNYPHLSLNELAEKAISGGKDGVLNCAECVG
jgi:PTS system ascorbate-specific IIA component